MRSMLLPLIVAAAFQVSNNFRQDKSEAVGSLAKAIKDAQDFKTVQVSGQGTAVKAVSEAGQNASNVTLQTMEEQISQLTAQLQQKENHASALAAKVVELEAMLDIYTKEHSLQATSRRPALLEEPEPDPLTFTIKDFRPNRYSVCYPNYFPNKRLISIDAANLEECEHPHDRVEDIPLHLTVTVNLNNVPHFTQPIQEKLEAEDWPKTRPATDTWDPNAGFKEFKLDERGCKFDHGGFLGGVGGFTVVTLSPFTKENYGCPGPNCKAAGAAGFKADKHARTIVKPLLKTMFLTKTDEQWGWEVDEQEVFHIGAHFRTGQAKFFSDKHFHFMARRAFTDDEMRSIEETVNRAHKKGCRKPPFSNVNISHVQPKPTT